MKTLISNQIIAEKAKDKPDTRFIQRLKQLLSKKTPIEFHEWVDTGRFIPRASFLRFHEGTELHKDCTDVVIYAGGFYIQSIKIGGFLADPNPTMFNNLDDAEEFLWENKIKFII